MTDLWSEALQGLQPRLGVQTFDLWLRPIELQEVVGDCLHLTAPNGFLKEWFETHYLGLVLDQIRSTTTKDFQVKITVVSKPDKESEKVCEKSISGDSKPKTHQEFATKTQIFAPQGLLTRYRFDNFIQGPNNELAASAAWSVAQDPGKRFNPLFIYGGVGLGKTHLLHAIGQQIHQLRPELRIIYQSAEKFTNEFITAVRTNQFNEFHARYRENCDVLLLDDIQFIAGRDRTMDEFFYIFNALYEANKQIVVTSDRPPGDMERMEDRLISRLNWGLVADIKPPDLATRVAILRQKAEANQIFVEDAALFTIAKKVCANVRELEGAFVRVATLSTLRKVSIDDAFISSALENIARTSEQTITVEKIQKVVADYFSVRVSDLKGQRRTRSIARPRMLAMYLCRELSNTSFPEIGQHFGGRDHSTVINACKRVVATQKQEPEMNKIIEQLREHICADNPQIYAWPDVGARKLA